MKPRAPGPSLLWLPNTRQDSSFTRFNARTFCQNTCSINVCRSTCQPGTQNHRFLHVSTYSDSFYTCTAPSSFLKFFSIFFNSERYHTYKDMCKAKTYYSSVTYQETMTSVTTGQVEKQNVATITESLSYPLPTRSALPPTCGGQMQRSRVYVHISDVDAEPQVDPATVPRYRHLNRWARRELQLKPRGAQPKGLERGKWHSWLSKKGDKASDIHFSSSC